MTGIKVSLRQKNISDGRKSLYLDFYPAIVRNGKATRRQFLNMYILTDKAEVKREIDKRKTEGKDTIQLIKLYKSLKTLTPLDRVGNTDTLKLAEAIRQKRENELNKPEIYNDYEREQLRKKDLGERCFVAYFRAMAERRNNSNYDSWMSALKYLESYTNGSIKFADLSEQFFEGLKDHLLTSKSSRSDKSTLSQNSAAAYFNKIKAGIRQAFKDGIIQTDFNGKISSIKERDTRREYLSIEELNKLVKTPCNNELLKRAALFSALTGLRFSDIQKLTWGEVEKYEGRYILKFTQKKTKGSEVLPISEQAVSFMGEPSDPGIKVFDGLTYSAYQNKHLFQWIGAAGITKDITFHCFRHTYATLQLSKGTDIYTVSKMLGHKNLKTTQVYAKIMDEAKQQAADKIKLDL
ncbi:site-specific integrase [Mangrovibacterium diazotrophicum]|uniref:Site-specific recombinase XerD n=1 Tax=Mangrovibacterium diazotrophicum TaxID=1261403 RepID=A0A419W3K6_9BACT|nr:site-specific integrase [Mangrovibacterium diazotrophicum]RKD90057.1 site-specific recombinase XerD [Mangrovibacterium diazotrophicum]